MTPDQEYIEEMHHSRSGRATGLLPWEMLVASLQNALACWVPLGYEDETGFHFGMKCRFCEIPVHHLTDSRETPWL